MRIDKETLNNAMAVKGLFIRDLCKRLNMTEPTLKRVLSSGGDVDAKTASRIAYVLNVRIEELEKGLGEADE